MRVLAEKLGPPPFPKPDGYEQAGTWQRAALSWRHAFDRQATLEFDRGRKSMSTVCTRGDATSLYVKGARTRSSRGARACDGRTGRLFHWMILCDQRSSTRSTAMASRPLRCLALATKDVTAWEDVERGGPAAHEAFESDLVLEGVAGIRDPPRPEAKRAIARCKSAGVRVFMITGDSKETAVAIGKELGILESDERAWRGGPRRVDTTSPRPSRRRDHASRCVRGDGVRNGSSPTTAPRPRAGARTCSRRPLATACSTPSTCAGSMAHHHSCHADAAHGDVTAMTGRRRWSK